MKFILPIIFILIAILTFIFGVNPYYKEVSLIRSDIDVYNTALSNSTNLQKTQDSLLLAYNEITKVDKDRLNEFLPSSVNNIQLILEVERIANLHNMPIKDLKFENIKKEVDPTDSKTIVSEASTDNTPYGVFPLQFSTEGNYDSFIAFLKDLEYNLRLINIKSVSFTVPVDNGKITPGVDPNVYEYVLKVEAYWLK